MYRAQCFENEGQDKELLEEEEEEDATEWEMWQVDEEEFGAVEETAAEAEEIRASDLRQTCLRGWGGGGGGGRRR